MIEAVDSKDGALDWASCDCYQMLGLRVLVRSTSWEFGEHTRRLLRSFNLDSPDNGLPPDLTLSLVVAPPSKNHTTRPFHFLYRNDSRVARTTHQWQLFRFLECQLDLLLAEKVDNLLLLHAGAVSREGAGIILPGPSGSGKSSLTLVLLQAGYSYLSDEIAVVDPSSRDLHPFPKPISVKNVSVFPDLASRKDLWFGPHSAGPESVWYAHPEDVSASRISGPVPVRFIIFPTYDSSRGPRLHSLAPGEALRELINNSINLPRFGRNALHLLGSLVQEARCFSLATNSLKGAVALIDDLTRV